MNRRSFLRLGAAALLSFWTVGCIRASADTKQAEERVKNVATAPGGDKSHFIEDVMLNSGYRMPVLGLGTWTLNDETAARSVYEAVRLGYRLIDTARYYGNERGVGNGIRKAVADGLASREELFVTTKIMPGDYRQPDRAIDESLGALGTGYIDLMLIHQPGANDEEVYKALERGLRAGKIRSIGISNYYTPQDFERILRIADIVPAVVQNENHPFYQNTALQNYLKPYGTVVESWYPLGGRGNTKEVLGNSTIRQIARAHGKTSAQIVLRWHIQAGYVTIPGSGNPRHIAENYDVFGFALSDEEMRAMAGLDRQRRYENW